MRWKTNLGRPRPGCFRTIATLLALIFAGTASQGQESFFPVLQKVNPRLVKVFGPGGIRGLPSYGTGILISGDGLVLTVNNHLVESGDLVVHLHDGTRLGARVIAREPELDAALLKLGDPKQKFEDLPHFNIEESFKKPTALPGTPVLAFSNAFQIATRDEPVSMQQGNIAAHTRLFGKIGIFDVPYSGMVYVVDAITSNPGSAGGALTSRSGELLGVLGREVRNELTNTWVNYAIPIQSRVEVRGPTGSVTVSLMDMIAKREQYKAAPRSEKPKSGGGYSGIVLVSNLLDRTPPFVEEVVPGSPAARAGIKADDLIVYIDGLPVPTIQSFQENMIRFRPGDKVRLEIRRKDKLEGFDLLLEKNPAEATAAPPKP